MRSAGLILVVLGAGLAYLGWTGKLGPAWTALRTGRAQPIPGSSGSVGFPGSGQGQQTANALNAFRPPKGRIKPAGTPGGVVFDSNTGQYEPGTA